MSDGSLTRWEGKYLRLVTDGPWEYVERCGGVSAVVILAQHDGRFILVEQFRVPLGRSCLELPAGLVGDEGDFDIARTALKELEEETGFTATSVERLGHFHSSPGMVSEGFDLVRAHGVAPGGNKVEDDITVHLVEPDAIGAFIDECRKRGLAVDSKLLLLLGGSIL